MIEFVRTDGQFIARSGSFGPWKWVWSGRLFQDLTEDQKKAIVLHETYHCDHHHTEVRLALLLFPFVFMTVCWIELGFVYAFVAAIVSALLMTHVAFWVCDRQEFAADAYAAKMGYGQPMLNLLSRYDDEGDALFHPTSIDRIDRLSNFALPPSRANPASSA